MGNYDYEPLRLVRMRRVRDETNDTYIVTGKLTFREVYLCDTLENGNYLIKPEIYDFGLSSTYSPKFKGKRYEIINVPGRTRLLIHEGNYVSNFKGCLGVGVLSENKLTLQNSKVTLYRINRVIQECLIRSIRIVNAFEEIENLKNSEK